MPTSEDQTYDLINQLTAREGLFHAEVGQPSFAKYFPENFRSHPTPKKKFHNQKMCTLVNRLGTFILFIKRTNPGFIVTPVFIHTPNWKPNYV